MKIIPVPVRSDNYAYLLVDEPSGRAAVVDPFDPKRIMSVAHDQKVKLTPTILATHHHYDHSGGNEEYLELLSDKASNKQDVKVYGGSEAIPRLTELINSDGFLFEFGSSIKIKALKTNCHTQDSICYFVEDEQTSQKAVFTGDTLFIAGCGRFFEGSAAEMHHALNHQLWNLPDETITYVGHEYTKSNADFALSIEPDNKSLHDLKSFASTNPITTGHFTIEDEKKFNPFMRLRNPQIIKATLGDQALEECDDASFSVKVMQQLRQMKNEFKSS